MTFFQSIVLGIVQGISEFLPISSSAHLILIPWFFKWEDPGLTFDVFLHLGTLLAMLIYFARDWWALLKAGFFSIIERRIGFEKERTQFWCIALATVPGVIMGMLFHHAAENFFRSPFLIAIPLASVGFLLYWIDGNYPGLKNIDELRIKDAILIGIAQSAAIIPGVSRSGSTMAMGRYLGLNRESAARFSFLLCMPITLGACVYEGRKFLGQTTHEYPMGILWGGFFGSFILGILSIHFLLQYLRMADFKIFAWYRVLLAFVVIIAGLFFIK